MADVRILVQNGYEIYLTPVGNGLMNLAVVSSKRDFSALYSAEGQQFVRKLIRDRWNILLKSVERAVPTGPVYSKRRAAVENDIFFLGDACEQFDPIGGMGMTHAVQSARIAAECFEQLLLGRCSKSVAAAEYERRRAVAARPLRGFTRLTYFLLVSASEYRLSTLVAKTPAAKYLSRAVHHTNSARSSLSEKLLEAAGI